MHRARLRVVDRADAPPAGGAPARWRTTLLAGGILGAAAAATAIGTEPARRTIDPTAQAREAARAWTDLAPSDPRVRAGLGALRRAVGARPLDARARAVYADLLFGASAGRAGDRAAAAHARLAVRLAPVTVPVVRHAAAVLAKCGDTAEAAALVRPMFGYDPASAADLLAELEPLLGDALEDAALPQDAAAWLAWAEELRRRERLAEAEAWIAKARDRFRDSAAARRALAATYAAHEDWSALAALLPDGFHPPADETGGALLALRARARAARGDADGAREDVRRALELAGESAGVRALAGDVLDALGSPSEARRQWLRALHAAGTRDRATRTRLLARLARLEERHGEPAQALRLWRELLALDPGHREAERRARALAGSPPA